MASVGRDVANAVTIYEEYESPSLYINYAFIYKHLLYDVGQ